MFVLFWWFAGWALPGYFTVACLLALWGVCSAPPLFSAQLFLAWLFPVTMLGVRVARADPIRHFGFVVLIPSPGVETPFRV
jgi:hypothetical protein